MGRPTTNVLDFACIKEEERLSLERERIHKGGSHLGPEGDGGG